MSEIIASTVDITRIDDHVHRAYRMATARGGAIATAATGRLGRAVTDIDAAVAIHRAAVEAESAAWAAVLSEDQKSDVRIGGVRDEMWTALGRPSRNPYLAHVFPGGITTYTEGDPRRQPVLMSLLESRIMSSAAPQWSEEQKAAWAAEIADVRKSYEEALDKHRPTEAAAFIAKATYRSAVKMGHEGLRAFKRDLQNLGLSKAQIFEIIPDGAPTTATAPKPAGATGGSTPSGSTGADTNPKAA